MGSVNVFLDMCKNLVRRAMGVLARGLNNISGGKISPIAVTIMGLLAHLPIAWLIATGRNNILAAILLIIFGLFDTLDGELARLQKKASPAGMFLDSVSDRMKEIMIYAGLLVNTYSSPNVCGGEFILCSGELINGGLLLVLALGLSLLTSYVNAWGEAVMSRAGVTSTNINKNFRSGLGSFEIRMVLLIVGLVTGRIFYAIILITILTSLTVLGRIINVLRELSRVQD